MVRPGLLLLLLLLSSNKQEKAKRKMEERRDKQRKRRKMVVVLSQKTQGPTPKPTPRVSAGQRKQGTHLNGSSSRSHFHCGSTRLSSGLVLVYFMCSLLHTYLQFTDVLSNTASYIDREPEPPPVQESETWPRTRTEAHTQSVTVNGVTTLLLLFGVTCVLSTRRVIARSVVLLSSLYRAIADGRPYRHQFIPNSCERRDVHTQVTTQDAYIQSNNQCRCADPLSCGADPKNTSQAGPSQAKDRHQPMPVHHRRHQSDYSVVT